MKDKHTKIQLKQLLKKGYSEVELVHMRIAPKHLLDLAIEEFKTEQRLNAQTLSTQHNQASFAMRLAY